MAFFSANHNYLLSSPQRPTHLYNTFQWCGALTELSMQINLWLLDKRAIEKIAFFVWKSVWVDKINLYTKWWKFLSHKEDVYSQKLRQSTDDTQLLNVLHKKACRRSLECVGYIIFFFEWQNSIIWCIINIRLLCKFIA